MALKRIEITAPGVSAPLSISLGNIDGSPKIEREGGLVRADSGKTSAGFSITNSTPDLYRYQVAATLSHEEFARFEKILLTQTTNPRSIQFADLIEPIHTDRIAGQASRTALGAAQVTSEGNRQNFQGFGLIFNNTPGEAVEVGDGATCLHRVEFVLQEIC